MATLQLGSEYDKFLDGNIVKAYPELIALADKISGGKRSNVRSVEELLARQGSILGKARSYAYSAVDPTIAPGHDRRHLKAVEANHLQLIHVQYGKKEPLLEFCSRMAAIFHDLRHPGASFWEDTSSRGNFKYTVEWTSAQYAVEWCVNEGFPLEVIMLITTQILATTLGHNMAKKRGLQCVPPLIPIEHPVTASIHAGDVRPYATLKLSVEKGLDLLVVEVPWAGPDKRVHNFAELKSSQVFFLDHEEGLRRDYVAARRVLGSKVLGGWEVERMRLAREMAAMTGDEGWAQTLFKKYSRHGFKP